MYMYNTYIHSMSIQHVYIVDYCSIFVENEMHLFAHVCPLIVELSPCNLAAKGRRTDT